MYVETDIKCPRCNADDFIKFVFVDHHPAGADYVDMENPSDIHFVFRCLNGHMFISHIYSDEVELA